jgi:multiple sugar transport system permease protein
MTNQALSKSGKRPVGRNALNERRWGYFFIAPVMLGVFMFALGPVLYAIYMSLTQWDGMTQPVFVGFANFQTLLKDPTVLRELMNTLKYTVWVVPATLIIAIVVANMLNTAIPGRSFFRVSFFLPVVTMPVAIATVWRWLFNSQFGLVNFLFRPFGLNPQWLGDPQFVMASIIVVAIWSGIGYAAVILLAGLQNIPKNYYEAASIDGASTRHQFFLITIPLLSPTIFFLFITSMISAFKAFDIIYMFAGASVVASGGPLTEAVRTMVFGVYQEGFQLQRMGYAAAKAVLLFALILVVTAMQFRLQKKLVCYD